MDQLFYGIAVLACPVGMGLMMWMMMRNQGRNQGEPSGGETAASAQPDSRQGVTELQVAQLRAEIDQLKAERAERAKEAH